MTRPDRPGDAVCAALEPDALTIHEAAPATFEARLWLEDLSSAELVLHIRHEHTSAGNEAKSLKVAFGRAEVLGRVKLAGAPLPRAPVALESESLEAGDGISGKLVLRTMSDAQGKFRFGSVIPGSYRVSLGAFVPARSALAPPIAVDGKTLWVHSVSGRAIETLRLGAEGRVDLRDAFVLGDADASLSVEVPGAAACAVHLTAMRSAAAYGAERSADARYAVRWDLETSTAADGRTPELCLPAGRYLVSAAVRYGGGSFTARRVVDISAGASVGRISLPSGRPGSFEVDASRAWRAVRARIPKESDFTVRVGILLAKGPLDWPWVEDSLLAEEAGFLAWIGESGAARVEGLLPGAYAARPRLLVAWEPRGWVEPAVLREKLAQAETLGKELQKLLDTEIEISVQSDAATRVEVCHDS